MASYHAGDCFLAKDRPGGKQHLYIVRCNPSGNPSTVMAVMVNTAKDGNREHNMILAPGSDVHPFINRESVVNFQSIIVMPVANLDEAERICSWKPNISDREYVQQSPISPALLQLIIDGALQSKRTPRDMKQKLQQRLGITGDVESA